MIKITYQSIFCLDSTLFNIVTFLGLKCNDIGTSNDNCVGDPLSVVERKHILHKNGKKCHKTYSNKLSTLNATMRSHSRVLTYSTSGSD